LGHSSSALASSSCNRKLGEIFGVRVTVQPLANIMLMVILKATLLIGGKILSTSSTVKTSIFLR